MMLWLVLAACSRFEPPAPTSIVTLREPGAEPRRVLSYHPLATVPGPRFTIDDPDLTLALSWQPDAQVKPPGLRYRFSVTEAKFLHGDSDIEALFLALEPGVLVSDDHGRASAGLPGARWTAPSIPGLLTAFIIPLPTETIGAGARWHVTGPASGSVPASVSSDYQLTALSAEEATVSWDSTFSSQADSKGSITLHGSATIRFDDLLPRAGHAREVDTFADLGPLRPTNITLTR